MSSPPTFTIKLRRRDLSQAELVEDLVRVSQDVGKNVVTRSEYDQRGLFGATTIVRKFGSWNRAIEAAGLLFANRQDITESELFQNLAEVWTRLGRQPFGRHMSDPAIGSRFATATYEKRFGSWNKALMRFSEHINGSEQEPAASHSQDRGPLAGLRSRSPRCINWRLRARILIKDSCICKMCGASPAKSPDVELHVDHIIPWSKGGETVEENLRTLCSVCNIGRSNVI